MKLLGANAVTACPDCGGRLYYLDNHDGHLGAAVESWVTVVPLLKLDNARRFDVSCQECGFRVPEAAVYVE